jgi:hypothetical protein
MSTGQQHHDEASTFSFETINAHVNALNLADIAASCGPQETHAQRTQRLVTNFSAARPILVAVAGIAFLPSKWRAVMTAHVVTLDEVTNSFKAGKDLAVGGIPWSTMEPKLPVG